MDALRSIVVVVALAGCGTSGSSSIEQCVRGAQCGVEDETCETETERCECSGVYSGLRCESLACPEEDVTQGMPCTQPGLRCDPDFEFGGYECVAPENVFVTCLPFGTYESRCPFDAPDEGEPCCWDRFDLEPCMYGSDPGMWSCVGNHWRRD